MPEYIFQHPKTGKCKYVFQAMNDEHVYFEKGVKWQRIFTIPNAQVEGTTSSIDPHSAKDFAKKTAQKDMTYGQMWELSKELSEKRGGDGKDEVKEKYLKTYEKRNKGGKHPEQLKREIKERTKGTGVSVEF